jgi:hypothetical protein
LRLQAFLKSTCLKEPANRQIFLARSNHLVSS